MTPGISFISKPEHMFGILGDVLDKTTYKGLGNKNWSERKVTQFQEKTPDTVSERSKTAVASREAQANQGWVPSPFH